MFTCTYNLQFARQMGTAFTKTGSKYIPDDNTYEEYLYQVKAWACPIDAYKPNVIDTRTFDQLWEELFS